MNYFNIKFHNIWKGNVTIRSDIETKSIDPFPWGLGYKRRSHIKEVNVMEFRVYLKPNVYL